MKHLCLLILLLFSTGASATPPTVLVLGDSLSAAYGLSLSQGWVALLATRIEESGFDHQVINASISGETSGGGLTRLPALLETHQPAVVLIALGANDGLRALPLTQLRANLTQMIAHSQAAAAKVVLIGVRLPPNYGAAYTEGFVRSFVEVADQTQVALVPRLLDGVAEERTLMQADGLHPRAEAQSQILDNVWPTLQPLLATPNEAP